MEQEKRYLYEVTPDAAGKRLDHFLAAQPPLLSRSQIQRLIERGFVLVNSSRTRSSYKVRCGDVVTMRVPPPEEITLKPEEIPLDIIYEDEDLLVINKPQGLVVHPAAGHKSGTLVNAVLNHCPKLSGIGGYLRPGIVHRLDKDTSGLILVSKSDLAHQELTRQLKERSIKREYLALVHGEVKEDKGVIDAPVGRDPRNRKKMAVLPEGAPGAKSARTSYRVRERFAGYTLLGVSLETGRTHQIRTHMSFLGHPVAGDPVYGPRRNPLGLPGQALHAGKISFQHPRTGEALTFTAPPPPVFLQALEKLRAQTGR
ncbi:pseudouridylate synthase RluA [Thermacetogenium phaeum DSM 12270]|uniref:Pseudouridine synthase n=1 Tax=Thermacetogenium phaeum (strain ATCC BAA-254 / DSM 26808 / PB) TaxID=1089553 RepID=K4LF90_THEPS|nr:RluA family pseudouridine synthase [Thermacetogenium phaeum]AFV11518.1 pseudouridylate synthase RluA [Thermacetogenium phaeum DSM 12270]